MSKITFTPSFKKKYSTDKIGIINIRITENRKSKYYPLGESLKETYWNKKRCEVKDTFEDYERLNKLIKDKIEEYKIKHTSSIEIIKLKDELKEGSFVRLFRNQLEHLETRKKIGTYKSQKSSYYHLINFISSKGKSDLLFSEIDTLFVRDFETYLIGINLSKNSCIKYIRTFRNVYYQGEKLNIFQPKTNPFIILKNEHSPVEKKTLRKVDVEKIMKTEIKNDDPLYQIKNYFLFQIFGQGMRVSDLMTLRWENLTEGEIRFIQLKTKKPHIIPLNDIVVFILKDYLPSVCSKIYNKKYSIKIDNGYSMNYEEIKEHYQKLKEENFQGFITGDKKISELLKKWLFNLNFIRDEIRDLLILQITLHSKEHLKEFIFPILNNEDFKDIKFNSETLLTKYQYNQMSSKTTIYNKQLKELQKRCELNVVLTSHLSRHTYTSLMIETTKRDIYTISKSLGHNSLSTTEHYVNGFLTDRVNQSNDEMNKGFH